MNSNVSKQSVLSSLFWKLMERGGTQGVQFLVQIVLARLISPEEFGIIAIVMVFINLAQVFVQSGFSTALIQKKDADEIDFSSVFYLSLFIASLAYIFMYLMSPTIGNFYRSTELIKVIRVLSLVFFTGAFNSIQNAYVARKMLFKKLFKSSLIAMIISGFCGIAAAYQGLGIWSLVIQQLVNQVSITLIMWFTVKWRPQLMFSFERVKTLFSFGWKLLVSSLLETLYLEMRTLLIGRMYTPATLGYYNRGESFPKLIVNNVNGSIQSVMLPTLSSYQNDKARMKSFMRRSIVTSSFLIFPMMIGLAVISDSVIKVLLTDLWLPATPFLQIFCLSYMLMPIHTANLQAINALGRSDIYLKLELIKKSIGILILLISLPFGVYAIALGQAFTSVLSSIINAYPNRELLMYGYKEQISDVFPNLLMACTMGLGVYLINYLNLQLYGKLVVQILFGLVFYFLLAKLSKNESYEYLRNTVISLIQSRKKT